MMRTGVLLGAAAGACWGLVFLSPLVLSAFSALEIATGRFLVYGLVSLACLLPFVRTLPKRLTASDVLLLLLLGACGNVAFFILLAASIQKVGVAPASLIVGLVPVVVTVWGRHDQGAASLRQLAWPLALVFAGVACINLDALGSVSTSPKSLTDVIQGLLFACGALASWSLFAVLNARALKSLAGVSSQQWSYLTGLASGLWALVLACVVWGVGISPLEPQGDVLDKGVAGRDWQLFWLVSVGIGIGGSLLANAFWNGASRRLPLTLTGQVFVFEPLFALLYGFVYEARVPRAMEMVAIVLMILGVLWTIRKHAPRKASFTEAY
ncbi:DMT family transporter [Onishia taeanensis]